MTRSSRVRVLAVGVVAAIVFLAGWRGVAAQASKPFNPTSISDLEKLETFTKLKDGLDKLKSIEDFNDKQDKYYKDLDKLSPDDDQYDPDYKPPGTPELPSLCKNSLKCEDCFKEPYAGLQSTRFRFDKLRRLDKVTKNMLRDAISFGDAAAGLAGGAVPLAWNAEKTKTRATEESFNKTYDAKYEELLGTLKNNLLGIAACEDEIFGNEAWYDRYGFIYHQFMAVAYRRPD